MEPGHGCSFFTFLIQRHLPRLHSLLTRGFLQKLLPVAGDLCVDQPQMNSVISLRFCRLLPSVVTPDTPVQSLSRVQLFVTLWTAACQASLSITSSWSLPKLMSIESVMPSSHLIIPFSSCPQSLPASGSFPMSQLFVSGGQSIGVSVSASVLPINTQD